MKWPTILVIGASGFIGGWVAETLCAAGATAVRAGVRQSSRPGRLARLPVTSVCCDVLDPASLDVAMRGVDVVINCVRDQSDGGATVQGTRRIVERAAVCGVARLVQMSSIAVYGDAAGLVTEESPPGPSINQYGLGKRLGEEICREAAGPDFQVAVLRPSLVYGPYGDEWTAHFIGGIICGRLKRLGAAGEGEANLIYVADLARFAMHLALSDIPDYSVYNANGADIPTFNYYFDCLSCALGHGPLQESTESVVRTTLRRQFRRGGRLIMKREGGRIKRAFGAASTVGALYDRIDSALCYRAGDEPHGYYGGHVTYAIDRARRIGFEPTTTVQDGARASAAWWMGQVY